MKRFTLLIVVFTSIILVGGILLFSKEKDTPPPPLPTSYEYFWGDGCPHCANVEKFFEGWAGKDKIQIEKKEVWGNRQNNNLMLERARYCDIKPSEIGVPFLFTPEGKCISGDRPIIDYFKSI